MQALTESAQEYQNNVLLGTLDSLTALFFLWKIVMVSVKLLVLGYAFLINHTVWKDPLIHIHSACLIITFLHLILGLKYAQDLTGNDSI